MPKNAKGGVAVSEEEIEAAFKFLDLQNSGRITMHSLKKRLSVIYKCVPCNNHHKSTFCVPPLLQSHSILMYSSPSARCFRGLPPAQYKLLLGEKSEMTLKDLKDLLLDNTVENFDPVAEAFKVRTDGKPAVRMYYESACT